MLRAQLGPRSRGEAKRLALQLASMCQAICSAAAGLQATMSTSLPGNREDDLVRHVIEVCQQAIGEDLCAALSPAARLRSEPDRVLPLFSEISQAYIDMRIARDGADHADIPILTLRRQVFLDVIGDRTPDKYYPRDLHRRAAERRSGAPSLIRRTISGGSAENAGDRKARPTIRRAP
jgi:hypothetical protein